MWSSNHEPTGSSVAEDSNTDGRKIWAEESSTYAMSRTTVERNEYLLELRNSHRNAPQHSSNRAAFIGDVVIVHDEDQPRGKWRVGKMDALVTGSEGPSGEPLFDLKLKQEDSLNSDVKYNVFTTWRSVAEMMSRN